MELSLSEIKPGDGVVAVEFRCGCDFHIDTAQVQGAGIDAGKTRGICEKVCHRCGQFSAFAYVAIAEALNNPRRADLNREKVMPEMQQRQASQNNLSELLQRVNRPTKETLLLLRELMKQWTWTLRFHTRPT
jgi:hypothetical protein